jgi:hypothetical protein
MEMRPFGADEEQMPKVYFAETIFSKALSGQIA